VTLNIDSDLKIGPKEAGGATTPEARPLVRDVLDELTSWNPREFITAFQRWHQGSLSLAHLNVLTLIEANGPMSMSAIAEALDISVASTTGIIDRMETRGLVKRQRHPDDRRVVLVQASAGGRKVFGDIDSRRRKDLAKLLGRLSDDDLAGLLRGHRALREARAAFAASESTSQLEALRERAIRARSPRDAVREEGK
jgi:DNA-binding MarR family transcriptional regulator